MGLTRELTMNISLSNTGEDSFMTSLTLSYPRNLHFKRMQKVTDGSYGDAPLLSLLPSTPAFPCASLPLVHAMLD